MDNTNEKKNWLQQNVFFIEYVFEVMILWILIRTHIVKASTRFFVIGSIVYENVSDEAPQGLPNTS